MTTDSRSRIVPNSIVTADDIVDIRADYFMNVSASTDEQIAKALIGEDDIVWKGRRWGWNDTEVRDQSSVPFERAGIIPPDC